MATINREALLSKQRLDVAFKMFDKVKKDAENNPSSIQKIFCGFIFYLGWQWNSFD
jgi:hypothetical protein